MPGRLLHVLKLGTVFERSDKTSRLHPRRATAELCQAYEPEGAGPDLTQVGLSRNERLRWKSVGQNRSG
jgi:hypothetical protein